MVTNLAENLRTVPCHRLVFAKTPDAGPPRRGYVGDVEGPTPSDTPRWAKVVRTLIGVGQTLFGFLVIGLIVYVVIAIAIEVMSRSEQAERDTSILCPRCGEA